MLCGCSWGRSWPVPDYPQKRGEARKRLPPPFLLIKISYIRRGREAFFLEKCLRPAADYIYEKSSAGSSSAVQKVSLDHAVGRADRAAIFMEGDKEQADPFVQAVEILFGLLQEDSPVHRILQNARVHDHELGI